MDDIEPMRFVFAFMFVLGLIALLAWVLKRYGRMLQSGGMMGIIGQYCGQHPMQATGQVSRIKILETRYIDSRRKLVLVRRDQMEHLLLLSNERELVVESMPAKEGRSEA